MSTEKKSADEKAAKPLEIEKLSETETGQLAGGFSDPLGAETLDEFPTINISKCYCGSTPVTD